MEGINLQGCSIQQRDKNEGNTQLSITMEVLEVGNQHVIQP